MRIRPLPIISRDKNLSRRHNHIYTSRSYPDQLRRKIPIRLKPLRPLIIKHCQHTILHDHPLSRKSNHSLNNKPIPTPAIMRILRHNNLPALRLIILIPQMRPRHRQAIHQNPIPMRQRRLHTPTNHVVATKNITIKYKCPDQHRHDKPRNPYPVSDHRVFL